MFDKPAQAESLYYLAMPGLSGAAPGRQSRPGSRWTGPAILFAVVTAMFWKLVFTRQYTWLNLPEIAGVVLPWFQLQAASLHRWSLALWDPYQWCGQPVAAQGQAGVLYPLNWLLWALPLHRTWLRHVYLNWYFVLIHFQAALFAYWLCRDQGRSRPASIFGGIAFAFGPFLGTSAWPASLNAAAWAPLQFLFFLRALRNVRPLFSAAACGAAIGASWLSGADEVPTALTLAFAALWIWRAIRSRAWNEPAIALLAAIGIGAMQIIPGIEFLIQQARIPGAQAGPAWQAKAVGPMGLVGLVMPGAGDAGLFAGCAVLAMAALGIWRYGAEIRVRISLLLGAAGIAIAVGPYAMFGGALYGMRLIWKDSHSALCLLALALPIPAAAGLDCLRDGFRPRTISRILLAASGLGVFALFLLAMVAGDDLDRLTPVALFGMTAFASFALIESRARAAISARAAGVLAILLAMWQFGHVTGIDWRNIEFGWPYLSRLAESSDIAPVLGGQGTGARIANPDHSAGFDIGDWLGIDQFDGLTGGTANIVSVADLPSARALGSTAFTVGSGDSGDLVFQSASGLKLFRSAGAFPRAWVVHRVTGIANQAQARANLERPPDELRTNAFVTAKAPELEPCDKPGIASLTARKGRTVSIQAALPCPGMVVISQTFYPGWRAFVDGRPAKLYEAYGFLDGVAAPAGEHTVELVYQPWTIWAGAAISAVSAVLLLVAYKTPRIRTLLPETAQLE